MEAAILKFESLIEKSEGFIIRMDQNTFDSKPSENKWSKKEILGHLIDSAINNIPRFTEIQFDMQKPYAIRTYHQDNLVKANRYQENNKEVLVSLWLNLNRQIIFIIRNLSIDFLKYEIQVGQHDVKTLEWLIDDYFKHTEYHLKQILES